MIDTKTPFDALLSLHSDKIESFMLAMIDQTIIDERSVLIDAIRHSLLNGGKRIRPILAIAANSLFSKDVDSILPLACSLEIIHTYSLIHDDLPSMDNDDFRRGKPTCHVKFGEDIAILAGDTLNTLAFEILSTHLTAFSDRAVLDVIKMIAKNMGVAGLVGGQVLDIKSSNKLLNLEHLNNLHQKKTGALIQLAITSPAYLHEVDTSIINDLRLFGFHLGLLFQIIDDILDVVGEKSQLGKSPGKDQELNKLTYPGIMSLDECRRIAKEEKNKALACLDNLQEQYNYNTKELLAILDFTYNRSY
ncbi:hypothetical protein CL657_03855 [bacterium]|nr:hypothetical protein [bacterium]|tara:strand:+ start:103 stop:1017 length:915 start_codon:yes stop_codon:yes gene_type:complete